MNERERLIALINDSRHLVFFGGAGVSTESGIPDFRSEKGLYNAKQRYGRMPEEIISHSFFTANPKVFFEYYFDNLIYPFAKPNAAHLGLAALEKDGKDVKIVTQNIDGLHQVAGSSIVLELHGSVRRNYCLSCGARYDLAYIMDDTNRKDCIPVCEGCGGMVRPDVVLYEEGLDTHTVSAAVRAIEEADLLVVGGTSLIVYPAAGFLNHYEGKELVFINMSETAVDSRASLLIRRPIGEVFAEIT